MVEKSILFQVSWCFLDITTTQLHKYPFSSNTVLSSLLPIHRSWLSTKMLWSCFLHTIFAEVLTQLSSITAVTNSGQPSHGCPPSQKLPRCWLVGQLSGWERACHHIHLRGYVHGQPKVTFFKLSVTGRVPNLREPPQGRSVRLDILPLPEHSPRPSRRSWAAYPTVEPSRPVLMVEHSGRKHVLPECADRSGDGLPGEVAVADVIWVRSLDLRRQVLLV